MGCDIHCIVEYKHRDFHGDRWDSFGYEAINPGRNYDWFAKLAGVRGNCDNPLATGFGLPKDCSYATLYATSVQVTDENRALAEGWVLRGLSKWQDFCVDLGNNPRYVSHPDWHTYGWCDVKAWKKSIRGTKSLHLKCVNAIIDTLTKNDCEVRVVFWFDN